MRLPKTWVAGTSIGAINAAIIADYAFETRLECLRTYVLGYCRAPTRGMLPVCRTRFAKSMTQVALPRPCCTDCRACLSRDCQTVSGLFLPALAEQSSYYDPTPVYDTVLWAVDFDYLNRHEEQLSLRPSM